MFEETQYDRPDQPVSNSRILNLTEEAHKMVSSLENVLRPVLIDLSEKSGSTKEGSESEAVLGLQSLCNKLAELQTRIRL